MPKFDIMDYWYIEELEEQRARERMAEEMRAARQARIDRSRRVAPKGTYVPAKLAKAKRRVVGVES